MNIVKKWIERIEFAILFDAMERMSLAIHGNLSTHILYFHSKVNTFLQRSGKCFDTAKMNWHDRNVARSKKTDIQNVQLWLPQLCYFCLAN